MGRNRTRNKHLPARMTMKGRVYWYCTYLATPEGRKKKWIRLSDDYQEALYKYADLEGDAANTGKVAGAIDRYSNEVLPDKAPKTIKERQYQLKRLKAVFGQMDLTALEPPHIQQYLDIRKETPVSANRDIKLLSAIYRHCIRWGLCKFNPCQGAFYFRERPRTRFITDLELQTLLDKADPMMAAIIEIAYITGMRKSDILGIKLADIYWDGVFNQENKTGKQNVFPWTPRLRATIKAAKTARKTRNLIYLFTNTHGQQITESGFNSAWRRLRDRAGVKGITFHDIRGKTATYANETKGLRYAQELLGHDNQATTEAYIRAKTIARVAPIK